MALSAQTSALLGTMPFSGITDSRYGPVQFVTQALGSFLARIACMMFVPGVLLSMLLPQNLSFAVSSPANLFLTLLKKSVSLGSSYSFTFAVRPESTFILISIWLFVFVRLMPKFMFRKLLLKMSCLITLRHHAARWRPSKPKYCLFIRIILSVT
jgi:hypothetical protein